jgi:glutamate-1-semialdehyde 2,1-aminomutase
VISGFRVALGGMAEILKLKPDLVCYGKILGGGFPVGCYGGRKDLMDMVAPIGNVYQAGTLSANPVGMRAGLATLQKMERLNGWKELDRRSELFVNALNKKLQGLPFQVSRFSSLFWIHQTTKEPIRSITSIAASHGERFAPFFRACLERGIYLAPNAYEVGFLSLAHDESLLLDCAAKIGDAAFATSRT